MIKYRNGFNVKKHLIIRINGEKASDKIQHTFIIYVLEKVRLERMSLSVLISMYEKPMTNTILNREKFAWRSVYIFLNNQEC